MATPYVGSRDLPPRRCGPSLGEQLAAVRAYLVQLVELLNTVHVGSVGLLTALACGACVLVAPRAHGYVHTHFGPITAATLEGWLTDAQSAASTALMPAVAAAWVGKPHGLAPAGVPARPDAVDARSTASAGFAGEDPHMNQSTVVASATSPIAPFLIGNPALSEGTDLRKKVLTIFRGAFAQTFSTTEAAVPKMVGDEVTFAKQYLQSHASGLALEIVDGALAFGGGTLDKAISAGDAAIVAGLVGFAHTVDLHLAIYA